MAWQGYIWCHRLDDMSWVVVGDMCGRCVRVFEHGTGTGELEYRNIVSNCEKHGWLECEVWLCD